ncbi:MAG: 3-oxoacyl-[acyl-carrier-protein] reductase [Gemmatimonadales bacterium]|nr:MAG: 3-oxoacyl-[acyl-carrier-protein] reductase [Gemmatimonadales bacterium]
MELKDRVALVTGGSRGIGLSISRALAEAGARVIVIGRDGERAAAEAATLPGGGHIGLGCDVADPAQATETVRTAEEAAGPISILVNNAGITRDNILLRLKDEDWDEVMAVNLKGAFNMTRALTRGMMKLRDGVILNITSVVGISGNAGQSNYAASKAGLIGFTRSVARELASRNVRCNAIAPGYIETDMTGALDEKQTQTLKERIPLGRLGTPEDVAALVRFLAGPSAGYITGQVFTVDGGMVI